MYRNRSHREVPWPCMILWMARNCVLKRKCCFVLSKLIFYHNWSQPLSSLEKVARCNWSNLGCYWSQQDQLESMMYVVHVDYLVGFLLPLCIWVSTILKTYLSLLLESSQSCSVTKRLYRIDPSLSECLKVSGCLRIHWPTALLIGNFWLNRSSFDVHCGWYECIVFHSKVWSHSLLQWQNWLQESIEMAKPPCNLFQSYEHRGSHNVLYKWIVSFSGLCLIYLLLNLDAFHFSRDYQIDFGF